MKYKELDFPDNKQFAFTIIDDTDDAFLSNIAPIYDILHENGLKTTKTVWVYPPRDNPVSKGDCLQNPQYLKFVQDIQSKGFEIGLHNVGSGDYKREEIIRGLEEYKTHLNTYPYIQVNHSYNKDNIYSGSKRFSFPLNLLVKKLYSHYDTFYGDRPDSEFFWGDLHKKHIKYVRNYEIDDINTFKKFSNFPFREKRFDEYSNYWFPATFASNQWLFKHVVNHKNIDRLEKERGICILYTHLGYYMQFGKIDTRFKEMIEYIGKKKNGWFVPVGTILDFLIEFKKRNNLPEYLSLLTQKRMEFHTLKTRIKYRLINKIDDFNFKKSDEYEQ